MKASSFPTWRWWAPLARPTPTLPAPRPTRETALAPAGITTGDVPGAGAEASEWQVLLNYRQTDEPYSVAAMYDLLAARFGAERIFRDCRSLRPGEDYTKLIVDVVRQAHVLVVVIGPRWLDILDDAGNLALYNSKDWVRREIELALRLRKHVVPVLLDGVEMPPHRALPRDIAELSSLTALSLSHRRLREDLELLSDRLLALAPTLGR